MSINISKAEWEEYKLNFMNIIKDDTKLIDNGKPYLWDILDMSVKIKNNMQITNGNNNFSLTLDPCIYLAAKFKLIDDNEIIKLLLNFYKYNECDYNYELNGKKIIDWCNERGESFIEVLNFILLESNEKYSNLYKFPITVLYNSGNKMKFAKLDKNNEIYYEFPEQKTQEEVHQEQILRLKRILGDDFNA